MPSIELRPELEWLLAQKPRGRTFGIDRMRALVEALSHPERRVPCIHIAGTNGKGSVAAMLDAIFRAGGFRVGMYTSPHLVNVGERVQVDRVPLRDAQVIDYLRELRPLADDIARRDADLAPSFFEYMTAMAFLEFSRRRCDLAIYEVGLGGRLDATNVVTPRVAVITSIGLDHCELLGDTIEQIAAEKAGIVKAGVPVVVGPVPAGARRVIAEIAAQRGASVEWVEDHFGARGESLPVTNLAGEYQRWNAVTATLAARVFRRSLPAADPAPVRPVSGVAGQQAPTDEQIEAALRGVSWPGRWERRCVGGRTVILDASHNPDGARTLDANLRELVAAEKRKPVVIVGVLGAARARPLLEAIARHAAAIHLVMPDDPRACSYAELRTMIPGEFAGEVIDDTVERWFPAAGMVRLHAVPDGDATPSSRVRAGATRASRLQSELGCPAPPPIVVTGSIYLVGEVMKRLG